MSKEKKSRANKPAGKPEQVNGEAAQDAHQGELNVLPDEAAQRWCALVF